MSATLPTLAASWTERVAAAVGRVAGTRGAVLCFHGFDVDSAPSPSSMHVPLTLLEAVVETIRSLGDLVPLDDLVTRYRVGRSTAGQVALTSDDAYASLRATEPILKREKIPLTIFAVSDALSTGRAFWWDRLDESAPRSSPERWRRFEDDCGLPETYRAGQPPGEGRARPLRQWVLAEHAGRWPASLEPALARLEDDLGWRTQQRSMTEPELAGFLERTGARVAVHTASHTALPFLSDAELVDEVRGCHEALGSRFGDALPYLAIPFGLFDQRTLRLAAKAGMAMSLTLSGTPLDRPFDAEVGMPRLCIVREHAAGMVALKASGVGGLLERVRGRSTTPYPVLPSATT